MNKIIFIFSILTFVTNLNAQVNNICYTKGNLSIIAENSNVSNVYIKNDRDSSLKIFNPSKDTVYLFSSYLKEEYLKSGYLNRVNVKTKKKKISLLPLIPFLSTKKSDKVIKNEDAIINLNQILYEFIIIPPNHFLTLDFSLTSFLPNTYTKDINLNDLNIYSKLYFKKLKTKKYKKIDNYTKAIEFAIYKDIREICKENTFYLNPSLFNEKVKDYKIIELEW